MLVNDPVRTEHEVFVLDQPTRRGNVEHQQALSELQYWFQLLQALIHQADQHAGQNPSVKPARST